MPRSDGEPRDKSVADVVVAFGALLAVSTALAILSFRAAARAPLLVRGGIILALIGTLLLNFWVWQDSLWFAHVLPIPAVSVLASLTLPIAALIGGVLAASLPPRRRYFLPACLIVAALFQTVRPLAGSPPATRETRPISGVEMQSSDASCGAASAVTLLLAHHLSATEPEMAALCGTRANGTAMLGIYRGLRLKTDATPYRVSTFTGAGSETLRRTGEQKGPVLIAVGLPRFSRRRVDPRYEAEWGWTPGLKHAVVFFGQLPNGKIDIGDPSTGRESWDWKALDVLWDGAGIFLEKRGGDAAN